MVKNTKVLVTGAAGFIGSHLSKRLEDEGHHLILIDDFSRGKQKYLDWLGVKTKCRNLDLRDPLNQIMFEGVDVVYHCASRIGGNQFLHSTKEQALLSLQHNLQIDGNVFVACRRFGIKKVIYTSSISIYNTAKQNTFKDATFVESDSYKDPVDPEGGYGWSKYIGEWQLNHMDTKAGIVRIFKSYGPCDDYSEKSGQVVCSLMRKAINYPRERFVLWGDGTVTRCLVYIDDLVDALLKVEKYLDKESITVNIGGNKPYNIRYLAVQIAKLSGKNISIENDMSKPVGVKSRIPWLELAKEKLNWEPTTPLEDGLKKTWEWMKEDMNE